VIGETPADGEQVNQIGVGIRRDRIGGILEGIVGCVSSAGKKRPEAGGTAGEVLVDAFVAHPDVQARPRLGTSRSTIAMRFLASMKNPLCSQARESASRIPRCLTSARKIFVRAETAAGWSSPTAARAPAHELLTQEFLERFDSKKTACLLNKPFNECHKSVRLQDGCEMF